MANGARQRSSIFTGLLLILLGILFLLQRFDPQLGIGHLLSRYWPVLLILWGLAKLIDHFTAQRTGEGRPPILSGPEAALMILVIAVLIGMSLRETILDRVSSWSSDADDSAGFFGQKYSDSQELPAKKLAPGAHVIIRDRPRKHYHPHKRRKRSSRGSQRNRLRRERSRGPPEHEKCERRDG